MTISLWRGGAMALAGGALLVLSGCSFVQLEEGADKVRVLEPERTQKCDREGKTTVSTAKRILFIPRGEKAIENDLDRLARNSAVDLGGDTVYRDTAIEDGQAVYQVYDCVDD